MMFRDYLESEMQRRIKSRGIDKLVPIRMYESASAIVLKGELGSHKLLKGELEECAK